MKRLLAAWILMAPLAGAQAVGNLDATPVKARQYVAYAAEEQVVPAGKRAVLELRFEVLPGYHVNSHRPKSELLLPTAVDLGAAAGVKLGTAEYPAGTEFSFELDPTDKLDVYAGSFKVSVPVVAAAGEHELKGTLKYQACNHAACYPPKTLEISVPFTAR